MTTGVLSNALVAQAIGGGGGLAGFVSGGGQNPPLTTIVLGAAGASGNGSAVALTSQSAIETTGAGAVGVLAQSIGGGGGAAQAFGVSGPGPVTLGASGGGSGDGGAVNVTTQGAITTSGAGAHAILAQSIGGGGGFFNAFSSTGSLLSPNVAGRRPAPGAAALSTSMFRAPSKRRVQAHMASLRNPLAAAAASSGLANSRRFSPPLALLPAAPAGPDLPGTSP